MHPRASPTPIAIETIFDPSMNEIQFQSDTQEEEVKSNSARKISNFSESLRRKSTTVVTFWISFRGIFYTIASATLFAISGATLKYLTGINPSMLALIRFIGTFILSANSMKGFDLVSIIGPSGSRFLILLRGLGGASALYLRYISIQILPLGNAAVVKLSTPAFVIILACVFLRESCGKIRIASFMLIFFGILFTLEIHQVFASFLGISERSHGDEISSSKLLGSFCLLLASLISATTVVVLRILKNVHHSVTLFSTSFIGIFQMSSILLFTDGYHLPECGYSPWMAMSLGIVSYYGQVLSVKSLQYEEAMIVSMIRSAYDLLLAFAFQIILFHEIPDLTAILGAFLVGIAFFLTTLEKYVKTRVKGHPARRWFSFMV